MSEISVGRRVAVDIKDKSFRLLGAIVSVTQGVSTVSLDQGQPEADSGTGTPADLFVEGDGRYHLFDMEVFESHTSRSMVRLIRARVILGRELRSEERIPLKQPHLWAEIDENGLIKSHCRGILRDISISGISFETLNTPPPIGSLVAVTGLGLDHSAAVIATVVGVDDAPSLNRRHVVRCSLKKFDERGKEQMAEIIAVETLGPGAIRKSMKKAPAPIIEGKDRSVYLPPRGASPEVLSKLRDG